MDVTEQITWTRRTYGKVIILTLHTMRRPCRNYANGGTWQHAVNQSISAILTSSMQIQLVSSVLPIILLK